MALLLFYILLALSVSFLCSIMEAVLLSVTPSYVAALQQEGKPSGRRLQRLKDDIDRPLAAILSLNTIAHTAGAAGAGAQAANIFGDTYVGVISGVLTLLILVFSEIIPKTLGATYWRRLAPGIARLLVPIMWLMWPFVKMSQGITLLLSRGRKGAVVSREEIAALAELGEKEGVFQKDESRILRSIFRFASLRVQDIMTPHTVVFSLPDRKTVYEVVEEHRAFRFSRIPVFREHRDEITGYVLKDDILLKAAQEEPNLPLTALKRDFIVVLETLPLPELFEHLVDRFEHIALVVDEYGGVAGIVTMEDVIETLLGMEIVDEADTVRDMQELARQRWFQRAHRLGLIQEAPAAQHGLTGGVPPSEPAAAPEPDPSPAPEDGAPPRST